MRILKGFLFKNHEEKRELGKKDIFFGKTHAIFKNYCVKQTCKLGGL